MSSPRSAVFIPCLARPATRDGHYRYANAICSTCAADAETAVRALPEDHRMLSAAIADRPAPDGGPRPPNKPASAPPINLLIDALRSQIVYTALAWEEVIRDHANLSPRRAGGMREGPSLVLSVRVLAPRIDLLGALSSVDGYFDGVESGLVRRSGMAGLRRLVGLHELAVRVLGHTAPVVRLPGGCSGCEAAALRWEQGSDTVWCEVCGGRWPYEQYRSWVSLMIGLVA